MEDAAATLATELDGLLAMARELEARVDGDRGAPGDARELCTALAASVDRAMRLAGNATGRASMSGQLRSGRKVSVVRGQVRVASVTDVGSLDDGLSWRKYGQKDILGATYPRAYFRCTHRHTQGCQATKQVQRAAADPLLFDVVYHGAHTCAQAAAQQPPPAGFGQEQQSAPARAPAGTVCHCYPSVCQLDGGYCHAAVGGLGADMGFGSQLEDRFLYLSEVFQPGVQNL